MSNPQFHTYADDWLRTKQRRDQTRIERQQAIRAHQSKLQRYELIKQAVESEIHGFENRLNRINWRENNLDQEMESIRLRLGECLEVQS